MGKQSAGLELTLAAPAAHVPASRWLYEAIRSEILEGRLRPAARLPATRDLAHQYGLSRGTIVNAYEQLKAEGYLKGSIGSGTYVSKVLPEKLLQVAGASLPKPQAAMPPRRKFSDYGHRIKLLPNFEMRPTRAFRCNLPALDLFPVNLWTQLTARRLRRASTALLMGCGAEGYPPLRKAVADYLCSSRGVKCVPEQVVIVSGVQEALDLTARVFLNPSDRVGVEEPGYGGASAAFDAAGAKISALPVDSEG